MALPRRLRGTELVPRMLAIGPGPGPKNVLVECDDGSKRVVTYMTWKHKYKPPTTRRTNLASEKTYRTVVGVVEFEPNESTTKAGQEIRNILVSQTGFKENAIKISATIWDSHAHVAVDKGDVVVLKGSFERNEGTNKAGEKIVYNNLSVSSILVLGTMDEGVRDEGGGRRTSTPVEDDDDIPY